jgi:hypothetical protein
VAALTSGCAAAPIVRDSRVGIARRPNGSASALAVVYDARVCEITLRDPKGALVDRQERAGRLTPLAMTRAMPGPYWQVHDSGHASRLFTALTFPPGEYELVEYATGESWEPVDEPRPPLLARTECGKLERHAVRFPFRIVPNQVTLLALPNGQPTFDDLTAISVASNDELIRSTIGWLYPSIDRARQAAFVELVARQRQPREGYDVYPACNGHTAVVRESGTPAPWETLAPEAAVADAHHYRPGFGIRSLHATGFGAGCVRRGSYVLMLSDATELDAAIRAVGDWLVNANTAGEVDLVITGIPRPF